MIYTLFISCEISFYTWFFCSSSMAATCSSRLVSFTISLSAATSTVSLVKMLMNSVRLMELAAMSLTVAASSLPASLFLWRFMSHDRSTYRARAEISLSSRMSSLPSPSDPVSAFTDPSSSGLRLNVSRSMPCISVRSSVPVPSTSLELKKCVATSAWMAYRAHSRSRSTSSRMNFWYSLDLIPSPLVATRSHTVLADPRNTRPPMTVWMNRMKLNWPSRPVADTSTSMPYAYMSSIAPCGCPVALKGALQSVGVLR
mmetsp:Transcript_38295/g.95016  ORF Transcript_38295/g.95016 Transcript_38295/m.95016 type:complete len:257 (+) Transcript_38295:339-1109(+)